MVSDVGGSVELCISLMPVWGCSFIGESGEPEGTLVYAYYKEGATNPTFLFPTYALKGRKC